MEQYELTVLWKKMKQSWPVNDWITYLAKGGGQKKRFQYWLNPHSSKLFLYFRAIQGHSGNNLVDPTLQDNVLLPEDFTEYINHVENVSEIYSIINSGLIRWGKSLKGERPSVFFTAVNPTDDDKVWKKFDATWTNQGLYHTKTLECLIKTQCIGAIWSSLRRKDCSFIKHVHTQSFSTTFYLRFVLRKRYAWRLRRSYTTNYISLQGCLVLNWSRIRKVGNRINLIKRQEHPQTTKAYREVVENPTAAASITEYQACLILQSNNRRRIAKKQSNSWFSSSRITRTRSLSCRKK